MNVHAQVDIPKIRWPALKCGLRADLLGPSDLPYSPNTILIEGGTFSDLGGNRIFSFGMQSETIYADATIVGKGGRDQLAPFKDGDAVFTYVLYEQATGLLHGLLSTKYDDDPILPGGCELVMKHPFAMCWRDIWGPNGSGGGFTPFQYAGLQNGRVTFNLFNTTPAFQFSFAGNSETPAGIDLTSMVPAMGGSRHVYLTWALYSLIPASCYLGWNPGIMRELVTVPADGSGSKRGETDMVCTSDGSLAYRVSDKRATFVLWCRGYEDMEVTD